MATQSVRERALYDALDQAYIALLDCRGVLELIQTDPDFERVSFPRSIFSGIRVIRDRIGGTLAAIDGKDLL